MSEKTRIYDAWVDYRQRTLPGEVPEHELKERKLTFYAGAYAALAEIQGEPWRIPQMLRECLKFAEQYAGTKMPEVPE